MFVECLLKDGTNICWQLLCAVLLKLRKAPINWGKFLQWTFLCTHFLVTWGEVVAGSFTPSQIPVVSYSWRWWPSSPISLTTCQSLSSECRMWITIFNLHPQHLLFGRLWSRYYYYLYLLGRGNRSLARSRSKEWSWHFGLLCWTWWAE